MALAGKGVLASALLSMPKTTSKLDGVTNIVNEIGDYMDKLQAGGSGSPGIFALDRPSMIGILMSQNPVTNDSWVKIFSKAWEAGVSGATITPGTVTDSAWAGSGGVDAVTPGTGSAAITNIPAAKSVLEAKLKQVKPTIPAPLPMAEAVHEATKTLSFLCIGLAPVSFTPIPLPFTAQ